MKNKSILKTLVSGLLVSILLFGFAGAAVVYAAPVQDSNPYLDSQGQTAPADSAKPGDPSYDPNSAVDNPSPTTSNPADANTGADPYSGPGDWITPSADSGTTTPDSGTPAADSGTPSDTTDGSGSNTSSIPDHFNVNSALKLPGQKDRIPGADGAAASGKGIVGLFLDGMDLFIKLIGSMALIIFIIGALLTIASEGKQDMLEKGKTTMVYAVIGIIISLMSFIIVTFVQSILF